MKILFLCGHGMAEAATGKDQRTRNLYEALRDVGDVYALYFGTPRKGDDARTVYGKLISPGFLKLSIDFLVKTLIHFIAPESPVYYPFPRRIDISSAFPNVRFDVVVLRYVHQAGVVHPWLIAPTWIDVDDHPIQTYETMFAPHHGAIRRMLAKWVVDYMTSLIIKHSSGGWVSNPEQMTWFKEPEKIHILRNVARDIPEGYNPSLPRKQMLLTVGYMKYKPNYLGVDKFLNQIWPAVHAKYPDIVYRIAGRDLPEEYANKWRNVPGVEYLGFVENLSEEYAVALASVVPIDAGGGTCIKTLESVAYSRVCLSTQFGVRGLSAADLDEGRAGVIVYDGVDAFLRALDCVLCERDRTKLEIAARAYYKNHFSADGFRRECADAFHDCDTCL